MNELTRSLNPAAFFQCLSDDTRLQALLLLQLHKELCVCDLTHALQQSQPKVSRHLAELRACGLVQDERRGKWACYRIHAALPHWSRRTPAQTATAQPEAYLPAAIDSPPHTKAACCCAGRAKRLRGKPMKILYICTHNRCRSI